MVDTALAVSENSHVVLALTVSTAEDPLNSYFLSFDNVKSLKCRSFVCCHYEIFEVHDMGCWFGNWITLADLVIERINDQKVLVCTCAYNLSLRVIRDCMDLTIESDGLPVFAGLDIPKLHSFIETPRNYAVRMLKAIFCFAKCDR